MCADVCVRAWGRKREANDVYFCGDHIVPAPIADDCRAFFLAARAWYCAAKRESTSFPQKLPATVSQPTQENDCGVREETRRRTTSQHVRSTSFGA